MNLEKQKKAIRSHLQICSNQESYVYFSELFGQEYAIMMKLAYRILFEKYEPPQVLREKIVRWCKREAELKNLSSYRVMADMIEETVEMPV